MVRRLLRCQLNVSGRPKMVTVHWRSHMMLKAFVLVSTVFLLMSMGVSVLSSTPLLILKHDVPMDSRVIRQAFHYSYRLVTIMAAASSLAFALAGRPLLSLAMACIALIALALHRVLLGRM